MITTFLVLILLTGLLWIGFHLTGALLSALFWLCIRLPLALILGALGIVCCCTLILIPVGIWLFKAGVSCLMPVCVA